MTDRHPALFGGARVPARPGLAAGVVLSLSALIIAVISLPIFGSPRIRLSRDGKLGASEPLEAMSTMTKVLSTPPPQTPADWTGTVAPTTVGAGNCMQIAIPMAVYEEYQDLLNPGDLLWVRVPREIQMNGTGAVVSETRYRQVRSRLVELQTAPVRKGVIFSSYQDLENKIDDVAPYVDIVAYNSERGTTPDDEMEHLEDSVRTFAELARSRGLDVGWGPTHALLAGQPKLLDLAATVDLIALQHQKVLALGGVEQAVSLTKQRGQRIRESNPEATINLQLRGDSDGIEDVLRQAADYVDMVFVLTAPGAPFDYRKLIEDADLRGGCVAQGQRSTPSPVPSLMEIPGPSLEAAEKLPPPEGVGAANESTPISPATSPPVLVTAMPSPTARPSGAPLPGAVGGGLVVLVVILLTALWYHSRRTRRAP